jgi:ElaB/YqjD/DUF883 family membrane-anchored ribosome-binding protein
MNKITKASTLAAEIKTLTSKINELVSTNASTSDIEEVVDRLQSLLAERRENLYSMKDPLYFIQRIFSEYGAEERKQVAGELESSLIDLILEFQKQPQDARDSAILEYERMLDVLAFIRFFKGRYQTATLADEGAETYRLEWGNKPGLSIPAFCEGLLQRKYISPADARLLAAILEDYKHTIEHQPPIDWDGTPASITTFLIIGQYLGILNPKTAPSKTRVLLDDDFGQDKYPVPPAASIINRCFSVKGDQLAVSTISRHHAQPIILDFEVVQVRVRMFYETRNLGPKTGDNLTLDEVMINLAKLINDPAVGRDMLFENIDQLDEEVLSFFSDMISHSVSDRDNIASELADRP